MIGAGIF